MKVNYQSATIAFSYDLTDPSARSTPIAVLVVGAADEMRFAAVSAVVPRPGLGLDPITLDVLSDVPSLIKTHVEAVLKTLPADASFERVLSSLHGRLRNSLHVAKIAESRSLEVNVSGVPEIERAERVAEALLETCVQQLHTALRAEVGTRPPPGAGSLSEGIARGMPTRAFWPLAAASAEVRA